jgi:hypothetical protein
MMTDEQKLELRRTLAEKVLGCAPDEIDPNWMPDVDANDALDLVDELADHGLNVVLTRNASARQIRAFFVDTIWALGKQVNEVPPPGHPALRGFAFGDSIQLAICRAALAAVFMSDVGRECASCGAPADGSKCGSCAHHEILETQLQIGG